MSKIFQKMRYPIWVLDQISFFLGSLNFSRKNLVNNLFLVNEKSIKNARCNLLNGSSALTIYTFLNHKNILRLRYKYFSSS